jgi:hypothetical protein
MAASVIEQQRALHEEIELLEKAVVDTLNARPKAVGAR